MFIRTSGCMSGCRRLRGRCEERATFLGHCRGLSLIASLLVAFRQRQVQAAFLWARMNGIFKKRSSSLSVTRFNEAGGDSRQSLGPGFVSDACIVIQAYHRCIVFLRIVRFNEPRACGFIAVVTFKRTAKVNAGFDRLSQVQVAKAALLVENTLS